MPKSWHKHKNSREPGILYLARSKIQTVTFFFWIWLTEYSLYQDNSNITWTPLLFLSSVISKILSLSTAKEIFQVVFREVFFFLFEWFLLHRRTRAYAACVCATRAILLTSHILWTFLQRFDETLVSVRKWIIPQRKELTRHLHLTGALEILSLLQSYFCFLMLIFLFLLIVGINRRNCS